MAEAPDLPDPLLRWFDRRGWSVRGHQRAMLEAARAGRHALLVAPTGAGKTLAGFLPSLAELIEAQSIDSPNAVEAEPVEALPSSRKKSKGRAALRQAQGRRQEVGLHTLYVSPLKALANDVRRNLLAPIEEMDLDIRVETRTGDTPHERKVRQRQKPPQMLLTTPESLSLLISYPDSRQLFSSLRTVIVDEVHAFAPQKRGDLLSLALSRLQAIAPDLRRVALSATVADPKGYAAWLAPGGDADAVDIVRGDPGAEAEIDILLPEDRVPWSGHSGRYAAGQVMEIIAKHKTTLVFCNTRSLAELIFQDLWKVNADRLPIGVHHGSLSREARRKVEEAMARGELRGLVATASLDLGVDWGDVDCVVQMGAPKGSSRLLQRIGRANHRLDEPSKAILVPGNRFEYLEARAALDAIQDGELDPDPFRPGSLDVLAQHLMACAAAEPFEEAAMLGEIRSAAPYRDLTSAEFARELEYVASGGYALRAYDKFKKLASEVDEDGQTIWRVSHPKFVKQHRLNAGIIVDAPVLDVRFKNGRKLGMVEELFAASLSTGDTFFFAGMCLEVIEIKDTDLFVRATSKSARVPTYMGARMPLSTNLADRVRGFLANREEWRAFPEDVEEWLTVQAEKSVLPRPGELLVETFPHDDRHFMTVYSFEGWNAHQSLGMLLTRRMETAGLKPIGFVANDYSLATYSLERVRDPAPLFSPDILKDEFVQWVEGSHLLKRAFREVAVIGGLVERQHPGKRKTGKQVTFSTDLIYDVLRRYEPDHLLLEAAWADARTKLTDIGRLAGLLGRAAETIVHVDLPRVSPMAVPVLVMIGREHVAQGTVDDALLLEAETLAEIAMG